MSDQNYIEVLQKLKKAEEETNAAIQSRRQELENEYKRLEQDQLRRLEEAMKKASDFVEKAVEAERAKAEEESRNIIQEAESKANEIAKKTLDDQTITWIIERVLLSDFRE
ncbi:MAG: hypothetical protein JRN68_01460 [Nitrososphaerota archaeon]|jgi:vacuolar-type H+-ATPase subunit H|nr:hypothetical protein [Nitrososphaerota archaeon]